MSTTVVAPPLPDAPYRGIEPFRFTDQQIFAARGDETWTLLSNVTLYRAVLLYGESGTGKSSLVNAGLLPQVLKENYVPDRLRVQPFAGREIKIERIRMSSGEDQAVYLPSNFSPSEVNGSADSIELSLKDFRARLEEFRPAADEAESGEVFRAPRTTPRPLLIFDQFEEFITLFEEAQRVGTTEDTRRAHEEVPAAQQDILVTLVELIQDETLPIKLIFSFREDYLAKLSLLFDLCPELQDQAQRLLPPGVEALAQIIRAPFNDPALRAHFLQRGGDTGSELTEPLAQRIAAELGRRSAGDTANLTELQIVCQRLWQTTDPEKLFAKDGIEGLLKDYGADVFRHFTPEQRDAAVVLLSHMVTSSNTRNIISEDDLLSRTTQCDFHPSQCSDALNALSRSQIVRREPRHSIYFYEITSEYLVPWIKEQVAERKSAEEQRLAEEARQKLEEERAQAVAKFETEKRRALVFARVLAAMILLLIITFGLGVFAFLQRNRAKKAEAASERILNALKLVASAKDDDKLEGIKQVDMLIKENKIPTDLKSVLITPASTSTDKRVRDAATEVLTQAAQTDQNLKQSIDTMYEQLPLRFFIHIADESQRPQARQVAAMLKKEGYLVPSIEHVGDKGVKRNQLRYFRDTDPGSPTPQDIVNLLNQANVGKWTTFRVAGYENSTKVVAGQFELWFPTVTSEEVVPAATGTFALRLKDYDGNVLRDVNPKLTLRNLVDRRRETVLSGMNHTLEVGDYDLTVELEGYKTAWDRKFTIKPDQKTPLTVELESKAAPVEPDLGQQQMQQQQVLPQAYPNRNTGQRRP